jgi:hypothetical protein
VVASCEVDTVHTLDTRSKPLHMLANIVGDEAYSLMLAAFLYGSFKPDDSISMSMSLLLGSRLVEASRYAFHSNLTLFTNSIKLHQYARVGLFPQYMIN